MGALLTERGNSGRGDARASADRAAPARAALKQIWQSGELSAHDLADEAALAHALPRLQLPDLLAAQAAVARFTPRFLRDKFVFPFVDASGAPHLAVGDPADAAPLRAAEIEFGGAVSLAVASFEDIATALSLTIKEAATGPDAAAGPAARLRIGRTDLDIRVATMPTQHGEAAVIRLLARDRGLLEIAKLGLSASDERKVRRALDVPHGMIVITGPTGSGKTTTLATMLSALNTPTRKILTIEDPIEYEIAGVNQSQVQPAIGLTFAAAMRAFVRQDPDVIMVGEVRDPETADIAVHAALTGHLVLTTLHTETAAAATPRLIDLGVEGFLLKSTLRMILAQRLVRVLCDRCKTRHDLARTDLLADPRYEICGFRPGETLFEPKGCERCGGSGYRGRVGVFECLEVTGATRELIGPDIDAHALDALAIREGMSTMMDDAVAKCRAGITSVREVLRVTTVR